MLCIVTNSGLQEYYRIIIFLQESVRKERTIVDRTQGLVHEARQAAAVAQAEKLIAEEHVRIIVQEERALREFKNGRFKSIIAPYLRVRSLNHYCLQKSNICD